MVALWLLFAAAQPYNDALSLTQNVTFFAFVISIVADVLIDLVSMALTITAISGAINDKHWDLLRLSLVHRRRVIEAKHALASIRVWRVMVFVRMLRWVVVVLFILTMFIPSRYGGLGIMILLTGFSTNTIDMLLLVVIIIVFTLIYLIEPYWRMLAQTAAGLMISARFHNTIYAALAALTYIVAIWIVQAMIMGFYVWMTINFVVDLWTMAAALGFILLACIGTAFTVYGFYVGVQGWALNSALIDGFRND
jgi:hypothetical protein